MIPLGVLGSSFMSPAATASYLDAVKADGPRGHWGLNEASGSNFANSIAGGLGTGVLTGTLAEYGLASPTGGKGVRFDSSSAYITTGSSFALPSTVSIEAWVYASSLPAGTAWSIYSCAASYGNATSDKNLRLNSNGSLTWYVYFGGTRTVVTAPGSFATGVWNHVVASVGTAGMRVHINNAQAGSDPSYTGSATYTGFGFIHGVGGFPDAPSIDVGPMRVSDVAFYDKQLSAAQVSAHFAAATG